MLHCWSGNQNLNTKSSKEAELVGVSNYLPYNINLVMFLEHHVYPILINIFIQDNQSDINMESNRSKLCTGNSSHIVVRYFFTKDRIKKGEMVVNYCRTELMIAGFFGKSLQGRGFKIFRHLTLGCNKTAEIIQNMNDNNISFSVKEHLKNMTCQKTGGNNWKQSFDKQR